MSFSEFYSSTGCSGGMFRMSALPHLCFGNSFIIPVASQRDTWINLFYFEKAIELIYIKFPGVLDWAFVEYKVLATHDL